MSTYGEDRDVRFEILEEIGVLSTSSTGWSKELNVVRWNGGAARYDIREWDPYHERMSKGITLQEKEMRQVVDLFKRRARYASRSNRTMNQPQMQESDASIRKETVPVEKPEEESVETQDGISAVKEQNTQTLPLDEQKGPSMEETQGEDWGPFTETMAEHVAEEAF